MSTRGFIGILGDDGASSSLSRVSSSGTKMMFVVLLVSFLVLAVGNSVVTPIYEPTDEIRHFRYVRHLVVYRELPVQSAEGPRAQSHHPPLYYGLGALLTWWVPVEQEVYHEPPRNPHWTDRHDEVSVDNKNQYIHGLDENFPYQGVTLAVHIVRWLSVLIGAGVVWLTFELGRQVFVDHPSLAVAGAAVVAFNPQFLHLTGAINNDVPAAFWGAAVMLMCVRIIRRGARWQTDVMLGILYGLALLTKFHLLALGVPIALAYVVATGRGKKWQRLLRGGVIILSLAALISGWWFWRNHVLYGDPTGMSKVNELWAGRSPAGNWWALQQGLPYLWSSLWGRFGYGQLPLHAPIYKGLLAFCVLALAGHLVPRDDGGHSRSLGLLAITPLVYFVVVCYYILIQPAGAMGRFLFPALPSLAVLLISGLSRFIPRSLDRVASLTVAIVMAALAVYALFGVLRPAFGRPRRLAQSEVASIPRPLDVQFGNVGRLLGYRITPVQIEPGDAVNVTLYWQALSRSADNYTVFVHLLSDAGPMIAQRDTYPGLGRYPTTVWEPGVRFRDTYRVRVPETAYSPDTGYVQVGLYLAGQHRLTTEDGRNAVRLASVEIQERAGRIPNAYEVNFDHRIALVGYALDHRAVQPGEEIQLTLYWRPLSGLDQDFRAFAHVLDGDNGIWASSDSLLLDGSVPTSEWEVGQVVKEVRTLSIPQDARPRFYDIEVGLHEPDGPRLPVMAREGRHQKGNRVLLSKISVEGS